ncbi:MAG: PilZ domain-containing protein [Solirubrobacteraceae bacterium]|jgi:hypothetical protein
MSGSPLLAGDPAAGAPRPAGEVDLLPAVDRRVSLVLTDEIIAGTLRTWGEVADVRLDRPAPLPLPRRGLLQYMSSAGVLHYRGALAPTATERGHCVQFKPQGSPQLLLARRRLRADLSVPVAVRREDGSVLEATTANIGESGLLLAEPTLLGVGEEVRLRIHLDVFAAPMRALATIVRVTEDGRAAAHYTEMTGESRERLGWRIFDHLFSQRRTLRC